MIKRKLAISALVLLLSASITALASCGGNKDTTHDAGSDGQVVTESNNADDKNNGTSDKNNGMADNKNENGAVGEIITDVKDGVGDIVDDVTGNGMNGNDTNGNSTNSNIPPIDNGGIPARMRPIPRGK